MRVVVVTVVSITSVTVGSIATASGLGPKDAAQSSVKTTHYGDYLYNGGVVVVVVVVVQKNIFNQVVVVYNYPLMPLRSNRYI